ncbi:MAG TPA: deoxyhypusine synthase [Myxococcota bacterium]|nr:deoxyhypusine synthase [Myxococcota bacterium]
MKIKGQRIEPIPMPARISVSRLVDDYLVAYNGARLREACRLMVEKILKPDVFVGLSISGALTPAGLGTSVLAPLIRAGFVDYIVSTGANLYHDIHYSLGLPLYHAHPGQDDRELKRRNIVRIYDIVFDFDVLLTTDRFCHELLSSEAFRGRMSSAKLHYRMGAAVAAAEKNLSRPHPGLLSAAHDAEVPIFTSSPGDSTIGMNLAALDLQGAGPQIDVSADVNEISAIVYAATRGRGKSAVIILGGGSPKNFLLQTEPQLQEILGLSERGHDYFIQITDARPDTGGLSGATPSEAVSWGKVDPERLPDAVVCYADTTLALPLLSAYVLANAKKRPLRRLYRRRKDLVSKLRRAYARRATHGPAGRR